MYFFLQMRVCKNTPVWLAVKSLTAGIRMLAPKLYSLLIIIINALHILKQVLTAMSEYYYTLFIYLCAMTSEHNQAMDVLQST